MMYVYTVRHSRVHLKLIIQTPNSVYHSIALIYNIKVTSAVFMRLVQVILVEHDILFMVCDIKNSFIAAFASLWSECYLIYRSLSIFLQLLVIYYVCNIFQVGRHEYDDSFWQVVSYGESKHYAECPFWPKRLFKSSS